MRQWKIGVVFLNPDFVSDKINMNDTPMNPLPIFPPYRNQSITIIRIIKDYFSLYPLVQIGDTSKFIQDLSNNIAIFFYQYLRQNWGAIRRRPSV